MSPAEATLKWLLKPAAWGFYFIVVFEILFMSSPIALYFYSAYGPALNLFHRSPATAWLTQFWCGLLVVTPNRLILPDDQRPPPVNVTTRPSVVVNECDNADQCICPIG